MKGLLLKDVYTLMREASIFLLIIAVFALMGNTAISVVYAALLPITALAYDERSKWGNLAATMPYSVRELVLSKYLLGYLGIAGASVLTVTTQLLLACVRRTPADAGELWMSALLMACVASVALSVNLPFMFRMGVERGRIVFFLLIAGTVFVGMMSGSEWIGRLFSSDAVSDVGIAALAALATVAVNVVSIAVSVASYRRKMR